MNGFTSATERVANQKVIALRAARCLGRAVWHRARQGKLDPAGQKRLAGLQSILEMVEKQRSQSAPKQR